MEQETPLPTLDGPVRLEALDEGRVWSLVLDTPKANILDAAKVRALTQAFRAAQATPRLRAVLLEGAGPHFSFGASVEEHLPEQVSAMLEGFHGLFRTMLEVCVPTVAVVRGQCLGGALELASFCSRVVAAPGAQLGQPEIKLGVIAPVASVFLPERVGLGAAEDLCLTGRSVGAEEALAMGLVDELAEDPRERALTWVREHLLPLSAVSLRFALRAARSDLAVRFTREIERVERLYLDELMATHDAREGLHSFLEKRKPAWRDE